MESGLEEEQAQFSEKKGGLRPIPFIIANEVCERIVSTGIQVNMIIYLTKKYHLGSATSAIVLFAWQAASNFLPVCGAIVSDAFLGRFLMVTLALFACTFGTVLLWLTAIVPNLIPPDCEIAHPSCVSPTPLQLFVLFASFAFMSIGAAGIRPCCLALGEDQFSHWNSAKKDRALRGLFSWYYVSVGGSSIIAATILVYFQDKMGWKVGFAIPASIMALVTFFNLLSSHLYIKVKPQKAMWIGLVQVTVVALKNHRLILLETSNGEHYHHDEGSKFLVPSQKMRFLNKACMVKNPEDSLNGDVCNTSQWNVCTVEQVENLKSAISVIPMWSAMIMGFLIQSQSFGVLQASTMDRRVGTTKFQIPAGSISIFEIVTFTLWSGCYDRCILPVLRKITRKQRVLSLKQRMGIGMFFSIASTVVAWRVEAVRRKTAIRQGLEANANGIVHMSAMWLGPQFVLSGLSGAFGAIGQLEFYYSVLPKAMGSFVLALLFLGAGVANIGGTVVVKLVNMISSRDGRVSWLSNDLNEGHYDYYYLVLATLGVINLIYFLVCCYVFDETRQNRSLELTGDSEELREIRG